MRCSHGCSCIARRRQRRQRTHRKTESTKSGNQPSEYPPMGGHSAVGGDDVAEDGEEDEEAERE